MVDDNTLDEMEPANRLELAYDQENKLKGSQEKVNLSTVKDSLYKSLYVKTKYSEDKVSEIDFMMDKMTMIGEKSHDMLYHLNPEHVNPRIEKQPEEKTKKEKKSNMVLPAIGALGLGGAALTAQYSSEMKDTIVNPIKSLYEKLTGKNDKEGGDENNIFGLTESDRQVLSKLQDGTKKEAGVLDNIVRKFSLGGIPSFASLLFGFGDKTPLMTFFFNKIKLYGQALYDLFGKIIKKSYNYVKLAMLNPIVNPASALSWIASTVTKGVDLFVEREQTSGGLYREANPINHAGIDLAGIVKHLTFGFGNIDTSDIASEDRKKGKRTSLSRMLGLETPDTEEGASGASNVEFGSGNFDPGQSVTAGALASAKVYPIGNGRWASNNPILNRFIAAESMGDPKAGNGSYKGLMQMGPSEARTWGVSNIWDAKQNFEGGKKYAMYHARELEKRGVPVTALTLYLAHQQGLAGVTAIWKASKGQAQLPAAIRSNMNNNGGSGKSPAEFMAYWSRRIESDHNAFVTKYSGSKFLAKAPTEETAKPQGDALDDIPYMEDPNSVANPEEEQQPEIIFPTSILPPEAKTAPKISNDIPLNRIANTQPKVKKSKPPKAAKHAANLTNNLAKPSQHEMPINTNKSENNIQHIGNVITNSSVWEQLIFKDLTGNMMA